MTTLFQNIPKTLMAVNKKYCMNEMNCAVLAKTASQIKVTLLLNLRKVASLARNLFLLQNQRCNFCSILRPVLFKIFYCL